MQFDITLKNEKERSYRLITLLFVVLHILFFSFLIFNGTVSKGIAGLAIIALYSVYRLIISKTSGEKFYYDTGFFFLFIAFYSIAWIIIFDGILYALSSAALQKKRFSFNTKNIEQRNFPFKKYTWNDFSNVVMRGNILTLDFINNRLLQGEMETPVNEGIFNTFASEQLTKI